MVLVGVEFGPFLVENRCQNDEKTGTIFRVEMSAVKPGEAIRKAIKNGIGCFWLPVLTSPLYPLSSQRHW